jgi:hypothetical protein
MTHLKIINASRGSIQKYENLKRKLYNCNANIYFNNQCLKKQLTPSYANIKFPNTSPAYKYTQKNYLLSELKTESNSYVLKNNISTYNYTTHTYLLPTRGAACGHISNTQ